MDTFVAFFAAASLFFGQRAWQRDSLIDAAKKNLHVRLLGDALPPVSRLEDTLAAWSMSSAREGAWNNAELLCHLQGEALLSSAFLDTLDGLTTVVSKGLLIPIP